MTYNSVTRIALVTGALAIAACSNPSEKGADGTDATGGTSAGTASGSIDAATGANVGATATTTSAPPNTANGADTGRAATDSANKAATSGNPTGSSSTRPTKP